MFTHLRKMSNQTINADKKAVKEPKIDQNQLRTQHVWSRMARQRPQFDTPDKTAPLLGGLNYPEPTNAGLHGLNSLKKFITPPRGADKKCIRRIRCRGQRRSAMRLRLQLVRYGHQHMWPVPAVVEAFSVT